MLSEAEIEEIRQRAIKNWNTPINEFKDPLPKNFDWRDVSCLVINCLIG